MSKLKKTLAKNATAAAGAAREAVQTASKTEGLRKRVARIKDVEGPSTTLDQLEWFAKLVGVAPWELLLPGFDPRARPQLLAADTEISGLTDDEILLIRNLRETGRLAFALGLLSLKAADADPEDTKGPAASSKRKVA